jgi:hypothetical protein
MPLCSAEYLRFVGSLVERVKFFVHRARRGRFMITAAPPF